MYASFLLKYSKRYLHTCYNFYMFILFAMPRARTCHIPSFAFRMQIPRASLFLLLFSPFYCFSPFVLSPLKQWFFFYTFFSLTDHCWWTWLAEQNKRNNEKRKKRFLACETDTSGLECTSLCNMCVYVCMFACTCRCIDVYKF